MWIKTSQRKDSAMNAFVQRHKDSVMGMLQGWDRLRFRGTVRMLANLTGMSRFLEYRQHKLKDFAGYAKQVSRQIRSASLAVAEGLGRAVVHLQSPMVNKEQIALEIAKGDRISSGLIAVLTSVESCYSYNVRSDRERGLLELYPQARRCQHLYHYYLHERFGLCYARLQTWFPFTLFIGINGREWLAKEMDRAGIGYVRYDNCFPRIEDLPAAQKLADAQTQLDWPGELQGFAETVNPGFKALIGDWNIGYYWSLEQSEYASDVMFKQTAELERLYPDLVRHAMESFRSPQVMSFLGRRVERGITPRFAGEVTSDLRRRVEGVRVKHSINRNSVKMYNKAGSIARFETTFNDIRDLRAPRLVEGKVRWDPMRKGVADIARRQEVSAASNQRYMEALAAVQTPLPVKELTDGLSRAVSWQGRRVRGLKLLGEDAAVLLEIGGGEYLINGFRNRDLQKVLFAGEAKDAAERRRRSGKVSRILRLLRAHGLIQKVPHTHRYLLTDKGRQVIAALHAIREANIHKLTKAA
jgi:hypothetical protein